MLQTPVRAYDLSRTENMQHLGGVLLSPAFSSPQAAPVFPKMEAYSDSTDHVTAAHVTTAHVTDHITTDNGPTPFLAPVSDLDLPEARKKRPKKRRDEGFSLDSSDKPPYLYATLIGMAILTHPHKQLTLLQIYLWISQTFKYYRREDVGWQNLIRHNLLLNKAFVKGAKSKDGKGHFWCIQPECEDLFLKAKNNKKSLYHEVMDQLAEARARTLLPLLPTVPTRRPAEDDAPPPKRVNSGESTNSASAKDTTNATANAAVLCTPAHIAVVTESPRPVLAGKHLSFALSFSCSLDFELLPVPPLTGPLLAPLLTEPVPTVSVTAPLVAVHVPLTVNRLARTPKTRTPLKLRTPLGSALVRRHWLLPSYLDEFYYLPFALLRAVLNSYDDDDMLMRAFDSPAPRRGLLAELREVEVRELVSRDDVEKAVSALNGVSEKSD